MTTAVMEQECYGSCIFMNMCGDIVLTWDEQNKERILEVVRKKMAEGYSFFTTKKYAMKTFTRKVKVTNKNIDSIEEVIISDEQFEKMCDDMNDKDIATLVRNRTAGIAKRIGKGSLDGMELAKKAEDVVGKNSVAVRPIVGG